MGLIVGKQIRTTAGSVQGTTSAPTSTNGSFVVIPEMTLSLTMHGQAAIAIFNGTFNLQNNDSWDAAIFVDGVIQSGSQRHQQFFGGSLLGLVPANMAGYTMGLFALIPGLSSASHTFDVRWSVAGGTARASLTQRTFAVLEFI